ncbi:hypothetical protein Sru01_60050 [Sphaerisporangium rufum]|uniref:Alpha/beta hydrolase fold-5 domain-containing protein n=1 Tax=Sphaerisporangium rufum TaxID=1381558 RepID=A0A919R886_9ACTN|nr:alpha/beta hydrolase [Sphaerisporangium rufum]GII81023.1 hypothetical protein Sru01_60050 [Sphaerisporangium rufum]
MRVLAGLAALVLALTACGGEPGTVRADGTTPSTAPSPATTAPAAPSPAATTPAPAASPARTPSRPPKGPNLSGCYTRADGKIFSYGDDLPGVVMGKGRVGVVISYERGGTPCTWRPLADRLVAAGYRVLLYATDVAALPSDTIVAMTRRLTKDGKVGKVFLVGGSVGGIFSVTAALELGDRVAGVVDLAGPPDAEETAKLKVPLLQVVAEGDGRVPETMRAAHEAATGSADRRLVVVPDEAAHASALFETPHGTEVLDTVLDFMAGHRG